MRRNIVVPATVKRSMPPPFASMMCAGVPNSRNRVASPDSTKPVEPAKAQAEPTPVAEPKPVEAVAPVAKEEAPLEDKGPWEVTDQVELVYRSKIDVAGAKTLSAKVTLKNKSEEDIAGKLVLVIDGCSVPGTKLRDPNGQFTEATPYLQIVPAKRKLPAGDESPVKSVILESETPTKELALESPVLRWRAYTLTKPGAVTSLHVSK